MTKVNLFLAGGGNGGVFGAGVLTEMQDADVYDRIGLIHSTSAGVPNALYWLSRQSRLGSSIYWEDLPGRFLQRRNLLFGRNVMDIGYLLDVIINRKPLDFGAITKSEIPAFARALNVRNRKVDLIDLRQNAEYALRVSMSAVPYHRADGQEHVDADVFDPVNLDGILDNGSRAVLILNRPSSTDLRYYLSNILNGVIGSLTHRKLPLFRFYTQKIGKFEKAMEEALKDERVLVAGPSYEDTSRPTIDSSRKLKKTWEAGRREGERIARFMGI